MKKASSDMNVLRCSVHWGYDIVRMSNGGLFDVCNAPTEQDSCSASPITSKLSMIALPLLKIFTASSRPR